MTNKKILYFDMDNVLVDFPSAFTKIDPKLMKEFEGKLYQHYLHLLYAPKKREYSAKISCEH